MARARQRSCREPSATWSKHASAGATRSFTPVRAPSSTTGHPGGLDEVRIELLTDLGHRNEAAVYRDRGSHGTRWRHGGEDHEDSRPRHEVEDRPARNRNADRGRPHVHHSAADSEISIAVGARISENVDGRSLLPRPRRRQYGQQDQREEKPPHGARQMILPTSLPSQIRGDPFSLRPKRSRTRSLVSMTSKLDVPSLETVTRVRGLPLSP